MTTNKQYRDQERSKEKKFLNVFKHFFYVQQVDHWTTEWTSGWTNRLIDEWTNRQMDKLSRQIVEPTAEQNDEKKPSSCNFLIYIIKFELIQNNIMIKLYEVTLSTLVMV
jgi:hypothetical protein